MTFREPNWDIDREIGAQAELWVHDLLNALTDKTATIEVKAPKPFLRQQSFYVEYECCGRDGKWRKSGLATTKAALHAFTFGSLPGAIFIETEWLKRAARSAFKRPAARAECPRGSNPTRGVLVSLADLWTTKIGEP